MIAVAFPFHAGDRAQALRWMQWNSELGRVDARLCLMPAKDLNDAPAVYHAAVHAFTQVEVVPDAEGLSGWPQAANSTFRQFAWHFYLNKLGPWLYCEPDCVPTRAGWLAELSAEYQSAGQLFLGRFVPGGTVAPNIYPDHLSGNAIYPQETPIMAQKAMMAREAAWDVVGPGDILPKAHRSKLIHHTRESFRRHAFTSAAEFKAFLEPAAVLYHTDKDGAVIGFLRDLKKGGDAHATEAIASPEPSVVVIAAATSHPLPATNRVHTYFSPVKSQEGQAEQKKLLVLWDKSWRANGWEPVVLTEADAAKHPYFESLKRQFDKLPTINPPGYEMACWLRWVAMSLVGGVMTDYDTVNVGFKPADIPSWAFDESAAAPWLLACGVPCAVVGHAKAYQRAVRHFSAATDRFTEQGREHVSDMRLVKKWNWGGEETCKEYGSNGWKQAKLVHFGHYSCRPHPRSAVIERESMHRKLGSRPEMTWIGELRVHITAIKAMVDTPTRKHALHQELRKARLLGDARKRK